MKLRVTFNALCMPRHGREPHFPHSSGRQRVTSRKRRITVPLFACRRFGLPCTNLTSLGQLLMGRQLRSVLQPKTINPDNFASRRQQPQAAQKINHDKNAHPLPVIKPGDNVLIQLYDGANWQPGQVTAPSNSPRSYTVTTKDGRKIRRNRRFLRQSRQRPTDHRSHDLTPHQVSPCTVSGPSKPEV